MDECNIGSCINYLEETVNKIESNNSQTYSIFICANCKRYYIKLQDVVLFEVEYTNHKWNIKL